jgi:hypothetical protein
MMRHTDRATINRRRPLTQNMRDALAEVSRLDPLPQGRDQAEKNALRALQDRGLIRWECHGWLATDAGRATLGEKR